MGVVTLKSAQLLSSALAAGAGASAALSSPLPEGITEGAVDGYEAAAADSARDDVVHAPAPLIPGVSRLWQDIEEILVKAWQGSADSLLSGGRELFVGGTAGPRSSRDVLRRAARLRSVLAVGKDLDEAASPAAEVQAPRTPLQEALEALRLCEENAFPDEALNDLYMNILPRLHDTERLSLAGAVVTFLRKRNLQLFVSIHVGGMLLAIGDRLDNEHACVAFLCILEQALFSAKDQHALSPLLHAYGSALHHLDATNRLPFLVTLAQYFGAAWDHHSMVGNQLETGLAPLNPFNQLDVLHMMLHSDVCLDVPRLKVFLKSLPRRHVITVIESIRCAAFDVDRLGRRTWPLVRHLIDRSRTPGELEQAAVFLRDFNALPAELRLEFFEAVKEDSRRTLEGKRRAKGEPIDEKELEGAIFLDPTRAQARLKNFLIDHLALRAAGGDRAMAARYRDDFRSRAKLWQAGNLFPHLASLAGFSSDVGIYAVGELVEALTAPVAMKATQASDARRFFNPLRYEAMKREFSEDFVTRWSASDGDRVIDMGMLQAGEIVAEDPLALRRAKYEYAVRQTATHLKMPGASHLEGDALIEELQDHLRGLPTREVEGADRWVSQMDALLGKMKRTEEVEEGEVEEILQPLRASDRMEKVLGSGMREVIVDLAEFKRSLKAGAVEGRAWLVITSNPADIIGAGRRPVTCQDPTRNTGHNKDGEPINRALEGRFLYAKVVMAKEMKVEKGVAIASHDAVVVARAHLEATRDEAGRPHVLVERAYVDPGYLYKKEFAEGLNAFARQELVLDPATDVHIQFAGQNMAEYPKPLPDTRAIYRDTFKG